MLFNIANIDDIVSILIPIFLKRKLSVFNVDIGDIIPYIRYHCYCILFRRYRQQSWSLTVRSTNKAKYCKFQLIHLSLQLNRRFLYFNIYNINILDIFFLELLNRFRPNLMQSILIGKEISCLNVKPVFSRSNNKKKYFF